MASIKKRFWKLLRRSSALLLILLLLGALVTYLLLLPSVQTWLAQKAAASLSEKLGTVVRIDRIHLRPLKALEIGGIYIEDLHGDTLIYAREVTLDGMWLGISNEFLSFGELKANNARFSLRQYAGEKHSNLTLLLNKLKSSSKDSSEVWTVKVRDLYLNGFHFSYHNDTAQLKPFGIDFAHVDASKVDLLAENLKVIGDSVIVNLLGLSLKERSGFDLRSLRGHTKVSPNGIILKDMVLETSGTHLAGNIQMKTDSLSQFSKFITQVNLRLKLDSSTIQAGDIAYFAPALEGIDLPVQVSGNFRGTVSDLKGRNMDIRFGKRSHFSGQADLSGLPDIQSTYMVIDVDDLFADLNDLRALPIAPFKENKKLTLPKELEPLGNIRFNGNFTGFINSFTAFGTTQSDVGTIRTDISYRRDGKASKAYFSGDLAAKDLQAGKLLNSPLIGTVNADLSLDASGHDLNDATAKMNGRIGKLVINGIPINEIALEGRLEKNMFNGVLKVNDQNFDMDFDGLADLRGKWPIVDFKAVVRHLDLHAFGFLHNDTTSRLSMAVDVDGVLAPDSLTGTMIMKNVLYEQGQRIYTIGDIAIESDLIAGRPLVTLISTFADATVSGSFLPTKVGSAARSILFGSFPSLQADVDKNLDPQDIIAHVEVKQLQQVLDLFIPDLQIQEGTVLDGQLNTNTFGIGLDVASGSIRFKDIYLDSVRFAMEKSLDVIVFSINSDRASLRDSAFLSHVQITGKAYQDEVEMVATWDGSSHGTNGVLATNAQVRGRKNIDLQLLPSELFLGRGTWHLHDTAFMTIDSTDITVKDLTLTNGDQYLELDGAISHDTSDVLVFRMHDLDLENLNVFVDGAQWHGKLHGAGELQEVYGQPQLRSKLFIDSLTINDDLIGDLAFNASWSKRRQRIIVNGAVQRGEFRSVQFNGKVDPGPEQTVDLRLTFDRFELAFVDPYLPEGLSDVQGLVTGSVQVDGSLVDPLISGSLFLDSAGVRIDYLNTKYFFSERVGVYPTMFTLDFANVTDEEGNDALVNGTVIHNRFKDFNFDFSAEMDNLLALNTTASQNDLYYGKAYGTGDLSVSGYGSKLQVEVDAKAEGQTAISFPLSTATEISDIDFISFIGGKDSLHTAVNRLDLSGISLLMEVELDPSARFELIFDPTVGDVLSGSGVGNVTLSIDPTGEFKMYGDVEVRQGDYLFTLRNLINKRFSIESGGRIVWYGDPLDAQLSLNAIYRLRAPLYEIMYDRSEAYRKRVPVEVVMELSNKLANPDIGFEVRLPTVDESVRTQVRSVMSTEQELNEQVFSLLALNRFTSPNNYAGANGDALSASAGTTLSEFASNQLSNWLSRVSDDVDLSVQYRKGDALTQDELELAVGTQLFNERLLLNTNLGVQYGAESASNANSLIGDFSLEYLLTRNGKLRLKAFSESNDRNLNQADQAPTTQGVGLAYREEFNNITEFFRSFTDLFRKEENKKGNRP